MQSRLGMGQARQKQQTPQDKKGRSVSRGIVVGGAFLLVAGAIVWFLTGLGDDSPKAAPTATTSPPPPSGHIPNDDVHAEYAGSTSCKDCHAKEYDAWLTSDHHFAERELLPEDQLAFSPTQRLIHGSQTSTAQVDAEGLAEFVTKGIEREKRAYTIRRVIGNDPLRQFLVEGPGGRMQVLEMAWNPHGAEWFNVYGQEDRQPGEWGHWTGRGMNWNAQCASCHNTRLHKNYDPATDSYHTRMAEMSIGCESCHGPMKGHVVWQTRNVEPVRPDPTIKRQTRDQMLETCAACHARRGEITGDLVPGESFYDHFTLPVPDGTDLYYPDGQVRDENFEFTAFLGSRMHAAGVRCVDCHDPHNGKTILQGNALCMQCHSGGVRPTLTTQAPVIDPLAHSHHAEGSAGNSCVACHMPQTNYMQIHGRHDHGFTIPDPLLTKEHGIPNACSRCHEDQSVDWMIEATDRWYGQKMQRPTRERTRLFARARAGDPATRQGLVAFLKQPNEPLWQAAACHLLAPWANDPQVAEAVLFQFRHPSPLVREAAIRSVGVFAMDGDEGVRNALRPLLDDPVRSVRVAAAWMLRDEVDPASRAGQELAHTLKIGSDQPVGQMQLGQYEFARGNREAAIAHFRRAVDWDANSAPFHHDLGVALNITGDLAGAIREMQEAVKLAPDRADYHFKLALAWNEGGSLPNAIVSLEKTVELAPEMGNAWYNLAVAYFQNNEKGKSAEAAAQALRLMPGNPQVIELIRLLQ